jgi:uncharacterized membrane protein
MDVQKNTDSILVDSRLIEELYSRNLISKEAKDFGLLLVYPPHNWGFWVSKMLLVLGASLILSSVVYFCAFNWAKITPGIKLGALQLAILGCISSCWFTGLQKLSGKILLLSASILVGVFLAVFGQIYQTGADSYNLFMIWALLISPFVIISDFAALWVIWLLITNIFLIFYSQQVLSNDGELHMVIFSYLVIFNGLFLCLREYCLKKGLDWLEGRWVRTILVVLIFGYILKQAIVFFMYILGSGTTHSIIFVSTTLLVVHVLFYIIYQLKLPDMWVLTTTALSGCLILDFAILYFFLSSSFANINLLGFFTFMGCITIFIFSMAIIILQATAKQIRSKNV